jgi:hypothetical protein
MDWVKLNVVLAKLQISKGWIKLILTWKDGYCHWCVHEEQHIEEQETQITEDLGSIITNIIVQGTNQKSNQDMGKQSQVHQSLQTVFEDLNSLSIYNLYLCKNGSRQTESVHIYTLWNFAFTLSHLHLLTFSASSSCTGFVSLIKVVYDF